MKMKLLLALIAIFFSSRVVALDIEMEKNALDKSDARVTLVTMNERVTHSDSSVPDSKENMEEETYTITYELNGGINNPENPDQYTFGEGVVLKEPTKEGHTFDGWFVENDFQTEITEISATDSGDTTVYAKWTANVYTITYELNGGINNPENTENYTYGIGLTLEDPSKEGHTFEGWFVEADFQTEITEISATDSGDTTIYAKWTPNVYAITYELDGGVNHPENAATYTYGIGLTLQDPTKEDFIFDGWYTEQEFLNQITEISVTDMGDRTVYAKWSTIPVYTITYELNGGINHPENPDQYTFGEGVVFNDPTKEGHTFEGWFVEADFQTEITEISATDSGDTTIYAKWTPNVYAITYELDGGVNHPENAATYTYGIGLTLQDPTKEDFIFDGWYTEQEFLNQITEISVTDMGDRTVYAKWTTIPIYTITYELNGGINHPENPDQYTFGEGVVLKEPTKEGHTFYGWFVEADFQTEITEISATDSGDTTIYAKWTPNVYTITYELNGGTNHPENPEQYTFGEGVVFNDPTKEGHTFEGWFVEADFQTEITEISATSSGDTTVYAKWTPNVYAITYELDGGVNHPENAATYTYGIGLTLQEPTKEGFNFGGWYTEQEFLNQITEISATDMGDTTIYAKWTTQPVYTITYELNGGINHPENPDQYTFGEGVVFNDPTKEGHTFEGWFVEADFQTEITEISATDSGDTTVYAKWTPNVFAITYELDGGVNHPENAATYTYGIGLTLQEPTKEGFNFGGWYTEQEFLNQITEISATDMGDTTVYAKWTTQPVYTITYELNGGTNHPENPDQYTFGEGVVFNDPTKEGHTFEGWFVEADFQTEITEISATDSGDTTVYAKWSPNVYAITYELDGGVNHPENAATYTYGIGLTLQEPTKEGFNFGGWYTEQEFLNQITEISATDMGDTTVYAKWTTQPVYTITYELNGGTNHPENPDQYTFGEGVVFNDPTKEGYTFEGWFVEADFQTEITEISATDSGDTTVYAKWTPNVYAITYELDGGVNHPENPDQYTFGEGVVFNDPTKEGHTFEGWFVEADFQTEITEISATDSGDTTVYAKWTPNVYAITYELDGGVNHPENAATYTYGIGLSLQDPTKEGFNFGGWFTEEEFQTPITEISATDIGDTTVYAKWTTQPVYTITYELDGGVNHPENASTYTYGIGLTLQDPTKEGFNFGGWYTEQEFLTPISEISATDIGDTTVYAKWTTQPVYTITYELNGGINHPENPDQYTFGEGVVLKEPTKEGHTFEGWFVGADFQTEITEISATDSGDTTVYAKWTPNVYAITYELDGGVNHPNNVATYTYGIGLTLQEPTKEGFNFGGWYTEQEFLNQITEISATDMGDTTIYAKWTTQPVYTITYELNGGTNHPENPDQYTFGEGVVFNDPTKEGHTFEGWFVEADFQTEITEISATDSGDTTVYAKWTPNVYAITYELDGGVNHPENPATYTYGIGLTLQDPTKEDFIFDGWYTEQEFLNQITEISATDMGDTTVYAKWTTQPVYTITYELNGGINHPENPDQYTFGEGVVFNDPTKEGHTFEGWFVEADFQTEITEISATDSGDTTVYAKWTPNVYAITYELDGGVNHPENAATYTYGVGLTLEDPTKEGFNFGGWFTEEEFLNQITEISATDMGDTTIYAKWTTQPVYTITYELNGGINHPENPEQYTFGEGVVFNDPTKEGHTFEGWFVEADFQTEITEISATDSGDTTVYAKWSPNVYAITYELDGGVNHPNNAATYTYGVGLTLEDPSKEGSIFDGWYTDEDFLTPITEIKPTDMGDTTLYAKWTEAIVYNITYELDGGINHPDNAPQYTYGIGLTLQDPTKLGFVFDGWYTEQSFETPITEIKPTDSGDTTVYAKWTASVTYNITYELDGGTNHEDNPAQYTFGVGVIFKDAAKLGHTFEGWYTDQNFQTRITELTATDEGDTTIYAKWSINTYTLTYELDGGINHPDNEEEYTFGEEMAFGEATKEGFIFEGWFLETDFQTEITGITATDTGNKVLYAKFIEEIGIDDPAIIQINIFPNPVSDYFSIENAAGAQLYVYGPQGSIIYQKNQIGSLERINSSAWAVGIYFVKIQIGNNAITKKIIKN